MRKLTSKVLCLWLAVVLALSPMTGSAVSVFADNGEAAADTDSRITYAGKTVGFFKEDGVSSFGMLSLQDGSKVVVDGDQVKIYNIPSNKTVYDGLHWGFITDENLTKDVLALQDGCWSIAVGTDNCGYGIPVAPVKTAERGSGTTGSQYYLCIPAQEEIKKIADYSGVDTALASVPEDLSEYTEESVQAVNDAVAATKADDFRFYNTDEQTVVDAAAEAINQAVAELKKTGSGELPVKEESFGFTLQVGQYQEGADFHTASFEGVTYALKDEDGKTYEPSSASAGSLTYSNLDAAKTYTFTASKEGWSVVKQGEWSVDAHAYIYTFTGETEIKQTITKEDAGKNISEYTNPGMVFRKTPREANVVDQALESVPEDLKYDLFTEESAEALKKSIAAADPENTDAEQLNAMAAAITNALQGLIPKDGRYEVSITKYNGTPYYLYEGLGDADKINGKAVLVVENGKMTAEIVLKNQSYGQVCLGTKDEVMAAATEAGAVPEGTIDLTMPADKMTVNEKAYSVTTGTIPVAALQTKINYAYHSSNTTKYTYNTGWYDHGAMFLAESLVPIEESLKDGTYKAKAVKTDVTTASSGMIMVTGATVIVKDGQATAIVTMKGTGADRFYVSDTADQNTIVAEAVAEEQKELNGEMSALLGGLKLEGSSAYTFWPVPFTLGEPKIYAARSASHFSKQDVAPEKYYYVHDFQIDEQDLEYVSDSTEMMSPEQEAQRYLNQFFMDGKIVTAATAASVTGKGANVTIPYYDGDGKQISGVIFKMADSAKFRSGWFVDSSILNTTYFTSSNLKKIRYPEGSKGTVTFQPKPAHRDAGMTFTATLKLYPADASYNQYDGSGVYYDKAPLAEQEFTITVKDKPTIDFDITVAAKDKKTGESIPNPTVSVIDQETQDAVQGTDNVFHLNSLKKYTIKASADGYVAQGGEAAAVKTDYSPSKEETVTLDLLKNEDSIHTVSFVFVDQNEETVVNPVITVTRDKETVEPEADGTYRLYDGISYQYSVTAEGYEDKTYGSIRPSENMTETVRMNKYLQGHTVYFNVSDSKTGDKLEGASITVKLEDGTEVAANEDGSFTVADGQKIFYTVSKEDYTAREDNVIVTGFNEIITYYPSLTFTNVRQLKDEIAAAQALAETIVESEKVGAYPAGTKETLLAAIQEAQRVAENEESSEDDCSTALKALKKVENDAKEAQNPDKVTVGVRVHDAIGSTPKFMQLNVTGDTAAKLKYKKPADLRKRVTFFDVVVAVHEEIYGDAFRSAPLKYLEQDTFGFWFISKIFGEETSGTVRSLMKINEDYVDYTGYYKRTVSDNDLVTVGICADKARYLYFGEMDKEARTGVTELSLYEGVDSSSGSKTPASGYQITFTNENGAATSAITDESGKLSADFKEQGVYTVTAAAKEGVTPIIPYIRVTILSDEAYSEKQVKAAAALVEKALELANDPDTKAEEVEDAVKAAEDAIAALSAEQKQKVEELLGGSIEEVIQKAKQAASEKKDAEKQSGDPKGDSGQKTGDDGKAKDQKSSVKVGSVFTVKKLSYKVTKAGEVTLRKNLNKNAKNVVIPASVSYKGKKFRVTAIANKAFAKNKKLSAVTIGKNVKTIGKQAFAGDTKLTKVTIGKNVKTIGKQAFTGDKKLKKIVFKGALVKKIGKKAFKGIYQKASFKVPKKMLKKYKAKLRKAGVPGKARIK